MAAMTSWIRQYYLRDLLDDGFDLFKERAITLMVVGAIPYLFFLAFVVLMRMVYIPENFVYKWTWDTPWELLSNPRFLQYLLGIIFFGSLAFSLSYLAQCRVAIAAAQGNVVTIGQAFSRLIKPFFSLLLVSIIFAFVVTIALSIVIFLVLMVVGIFSLLVSLAIRGSVNGNSADSPGGFISFLSVVFSLLLITAWVTSLVLTLNFFVTSILTAPMTMVNENAGPFTAIGRAIKIAGSNFKAHFWSTLVIGNMQFIILPSLIVIQLLLFMVIKPFAPTMDNTLVGSLAIGMASIIFLGLISCQQALAYLDGKSRTESYDLLILARQIGLEQEFKEAFRTANTSPAANIALQAGYPDYSKVPATQLNNYLPTNSSTIIANPDYSAPPPPVVETNNVIIPPVADTMEKQDGDQQNEG